MKRQRMTSIVILITLLLNFLLNTSVVFAVNIIDSGKIINRVTNDEILWSLDDEGTLTIGGKRRNGNVYNIYKWWS